MNLRPFQIIILGFFLALAVGGLIFFAVFRGFGSEPNPYGTSVEIWGTFSQVEVMSAIDKIIRDDQDFVVVTYIQKDARAFQNELVNAIAEGRGPDAVILPSNLLVSERAKIYPIPYSTLSARTIRDTYVDGAEIFSLSDGIYGVPFAVDPLVMYWNRDLFSTAGLASAPTTWEAMVGTVVPALVSFAPAPLYSITQAAVSFGEYANVTNAPEIMLMLMLQAGSPMITERQDGVYNVGFNTIVGQTERLPADAALDFYTQFANPARPNYTWNRSMANDRGLFLAGDLAMYFGFGSEYAGLRAGNPNLNFDAAAVPQGSTVLIKKNFGTVYAFSMLKSSDNIAGTYNALIKLGSAEHVRSILETLGLAPAHRQLIAEGSPDPFRQTIYNMALIARGFLDPNPSSSENIIKTMIEDITSGRSRVGTAVGDAEGRFRQLLP